MQHRHRIESSVHCSARLPGSPTVFLAITIASAELIKHASNSFLGLKISYANVVADLCERIGSNVEEVTRAVGLDPRIGSQFLSAGLGFGGFCLRRTFRPSFTWRIGKAWILAY